MQSITRCVALSAVIVVASQPCLSQTTKSGDGIELFSPGSLPAPSPNDAAPAFSPDGKTLYVGRHLDNGTDTIVVSELIGGKWSAAKNAAFSGRARDLEPAFDPSGRYLIFASNRPSMAGAPPLDGRWGAEDRPGKGGNLWQVDVRRPNAAPRRLPAEINTSASTFSPAIAKDGSLWFMRADDGNKFHIFRAQARSGTFVNVRPAPFTDAQFNDYDPAVAPDESFVIFSSSSMRNGNTPSSTDLFITFNARQGWSKPLDLREAISPRVHGIEARLSPDAHTLYFTNSDSPAGQSDSGVERYIWSVRLDVDRLRDKAAS